MVRVKYREDVDFSRSQTSWWLVRFRENFLAQTFGQELNVPLRLRMRQLYWGWLCRWGRGKHPPQTIEAADFNIERRAWDYLRMKSTSVNCQEERERVDHVIQVKGWNKPFSRLIEGTLLAYRLQLWTVNIRNKTDQVEAKHLFVIVNLVPFDGIEEIVKQRLGEKVIGFGQNNKALMKTAPTCKKSLLKIFQKFGIISESWLDACQSFASREQLIYADDLVRLLKEAKKCLGQTIPNLCYLMMMSSWNLTTKPFKKSLIRPSNARPGARGLRSIIEETMLDVMFWSTESRKCEIGPHHKRSCRWNG